MSQTNGNPIFTSRKESGYSPKLLNIDLSIGSIDTGYVKESVARKFLGGAGLAAKIVWEALCPIGTQCLIHDYEKVHQAYDFCNQYGLDSISTGAVVAFAIECKENGIIKEDLLEGLDLGWGKADAMLSILKKITFREGKLANILAEGTARAAELLGNDAEKYAIAYDLHAAGSQWKRRQPSGSFSQREKSRRPGRRKSSGS